MKLLGSMSDPYNYYISHLGWRSSWQILNHANERVFASGHEQKKAEKEVRNSKISVYESDPFGDPFELFVDKDDDMASMANSSTSINDDVAKEVANVENHDNLFDQSPNTVEGAMERLSTKATMDESIEQPESVEG